MDIETLGWHQDRMNIVRLERTAARAFLLAAIDAAALEDIHTLFVAIDEDGGRCIKFKINYGVWSPPYNETTGELEGAAAE